MISGGEPPIVTCKWDRDGFIKSTTRMRIREGQPDDCWVDEDGTITKLKKFYKSDEARIWYGKWSECPNDKAGAKEWTMKEVAKGISKMMGR